MSKYLKYAILIGSIAILTLAIHSNCESCQQRFAKFKGML